MQEDKRLERLYDYTKFHIGIYLASASGLATLLGSLANEKAAIFLVELIGSPLALSLSLLFMIFAGAAGGVVATSVTESETFNEFWSAPQGPFRIYLISGRTWVCVLRNTVMQNRRAFVNTFAVAMTIFIVVAASDSMAQNASHPSPETLVMTNARTAMLQATGVAQQAAPAHRWEIDRWYHWYNWNVWQDCAKDAPRSNPDDWYDAHPDAMKCMTGKFQARTAALEHFVAQVKAGAALDDALKAIEVANSSAAQAPTQSATVAAPAAVNVSPWNGSAAKLVHNSNGSLLEYTDTAGTQHQYAVARPKMLQGMAGDLGSWLYVSPDKKSGTMFQLGADGSVRGDPVNPAKLAFLVGP